MLFEQCYYSNDFNNLTHKLFLLTTNFFNKFMSKAIVFDLDGTLVDSAPDLMDAHNYVMKKFGYPTKKLTYILHLSGIGASKMILRYLK